MKKKKVRIEIIVLNEIIVMLTMIDFCTIVCQTRHRLRRLTNHRTGVSQAIGLKNFVNIRKTILNETLHKPYTSTIRRD